MYEVLTLNELHKNVSKQRNICKSNVFWTVMYLSLTTSWKDKQYGVPLIRL